MRRVTARAASLSVSLDEDRRARDAAAKRVEVRCVVGGCRGLRPCRGWPCGVALCREAPCREAPCRRAPCRLRYVGVRYVGIVGVPCRGAIAMSEAKRCCAMSRHVLRHVDIAVLRHVV